MRENSERPVRIFQKRRFPTRNALLKLFSRRVPNSHAARLDAFWDPPGQISHQFSHQFSHNFHKFSRTGPGGLLRAFWARPGEAQPSSQATRFARISGPLLRPLGTRLAKTREVPRIMRNPAHSHRLHGDDRRRMVPLTWRRHPEPAPRCITTTAPQNEKTCEIFGPTGPAGSPKKVLQTISRVLEDTLFPPTPPIDS